MSLLKMWPILWGLNTQGGRTSLKTHLAITNLECDNKNAKMVRYNAATHHKINFKMSLKFKPKNT